LKKISRSTAITVADPEPNLAVIPEQAAAQGMSVAQFVAILSAYWKQIAVITAVVTVFQDTGEIIRSSPGAGCGPGRADDENQLLRY